MAQAISLGCYAQLYRQVLAALGAWIRFRLAADVTLATFFISHVTPFGSATGTLVNASTLETGPLAVAYAAANIASTIPVTPGGLGVIEVTLVAITVGFGAPRATAVLAVLGYRIVNYRLPLPPGAIAYLRLRLRSGADGNRKGKGKPAARQAG